MTSAFPRRNRVSTAIGLLLNASTKCPLTMMIMPLWRRHSPTLTPNPQSGKASSSLLRHLLGVSALQRCLKPSGTGFNAVAFFCANEFFPSFLFSLREAQNRNAPETVSRKIQKGLFQLQEEACQGELPGRAYLGKDSIADQHKPPVRRANPGLRRVHRAKSRLRISARPRHQTT